MLEKLNRYFEDKPFDARVSAAIGAIILTGTLVSFGVLPHWVYAAVVLSAIYALFRFARNADKETRQKIDLLIAAETIVAFGIVGLIFGLTISVLPILSAPLPEGGLSLTTLSPIIQMFLFSLSGAAFAPIFAVLLRNHEFAVTSTGTPSGGLDADDLSPVFKKLSDELTAMVTKVETLSAVVEHGAGAFKASLSEASSSVSGFATGVKEEVAGLEKNMAAASHQIESLQKSFSDLTGKTKDTGDALSQMKAVANQNSQMLEELSRLIETIDRFIQNDGR